MAGKAILRYRDFANQVSNFEFLTATLTAGNIAGIDTQLDAVVAAAAGIGLGLLNVKQLVAEVEEISSAKATDPSSRRENKWLLTFLDVVDGHLETKEFPMVDTTNALLFGSDGETADLTSTEWAAFKTAIEAIYRSNTFHSCTLQGARFVGRNL